MGVPQDIGARSRGFFLHSAEQVAAAAADNDDWPLMENLRVSAAAAAAAAARRIHAFHTVSFLSHF
jgi:hypothetical protein